MIRVEHKNISKHTETAVLIGVITENQSEEIVNDHMQELEQLTKTAGAQTKKKIIQKLPYSDPKTYVGKGKLFEISSFIKINKIDIAIFDDELTGSQLRNIEKEFECKVLDRSNLILDIFAIHARTAQAKIQVELAQNEYILPRLTGMWTHLSKQKGGIGMRGGPGEKEIETDRRIVKNKISVLKKKLLEIDKQNAVRKKQRGGLIRVALVGYTNAGKSTVMNLLSKSDVLVQDKLFATLDTTVRKVVIENVPFLLSDTVGFIRKLPHKLIESFKSTLEEVRESDLLIHVADISHPNFEEHVEVVNETLMEIGVIDKPVILVLNKIDLFKSDEEKTIDQFSSNFVSNAWMTKSTDQCIPISATQKINIGKLKNRIFENVKEMHVKRYPYNAYSD